MGIPFPQEASDVFAFVQVVSAQGKFAYAKFKMPPAHIGRFLDSLCEADYEIGAWPNRKWEWSFWDYGILVPFGWQPPTDLNTTDYVRCSPTRGSDNVGVFMWIDQTNDSVHTIWMELSYSS